MPGLSRDQLGREAVLVLGWFAGLGVLGGVLWWLLTPLAEWTRTAKSASMDELNLGITVAADGWFFVIGAVGGLLSGFVLAAWRRRDPVTTVLLLTVGAGLASVLMYVVGHVLGPGALQESLAHARVGEKVPVPLDVAAPAVYLVWPVATLLTAVAVLWGTSDDTARVETSDLPS
jgi:uncharacterized membrane protein